MSELKYMQLALELAAQGVGRTSPNPPVGAVVVKNGEVVGRGFHPAAGEPHAEVFALRDAGPAASGADIYVTLEPCNHTGKTGPCTEAVIAAGIKRVFVGCVDPNPLVAGSGIRRLEAAGIVVKSGLLEKDCQRLIAPFAKQVATGLPYVLLKLAMTLDGQTATSSGDSQWITGEKSRQRVHQMRDKADAIMAGIGTVLADDPALNTRLPEGGQDPLRIVVDSNLRLPLDAAVIKSSESAPLVVVTCADPDQQKVPALQERGVEILCLTADKEGQVDLGAMMTALGKRGVQSILLEGGATLAAAMLRHKLVDSLALFIAPKLLGGNDGTSLLNGPGCRLLGEAIELNDIRISRYGDDILVEGEVC